MYEETVSISKEYGYTHYEVSSYAKTPSAISRHNFSYWQGMDYLGISQSLENRNLLYANVAFRGWTWSTWKIDRL